MTARRSGCGPKPKLVPHDDALRARVAAEPDITLAELQAWLLAERKVNVSIGCLWNRLKFLKLPLKKSRSEPPSRIAQMWPKRVEPTLDQEQGSLGSEGAAPNAAQGQTRKRQ